MQYFREIQKSVQLFSLPGFVIELEAIQLDCEKRGKFTYLKSFVNFYLLPTVFAVELIFQFLRLEILLQTLLQRLEFLLSVGIVDGEGDVHESLLLLTEMFTALDE